MVGPFVIAILLLVSTVKVARTAEDKCTNLTDVGEPLILTPFIKNGSLEMAKELSKVTVAGWSGHSGYFTVNEGCGGKMFFWFIPAKNNSESAPVFLWLNGGPGSTSLFGLFVEIGPFKFSNARGIEPRNVTWNHNNNILYVDQPVGTGFSLPKNSCLAENMTVSTEQLYSFLVQFYRVFAGYQSNKLYLTGQSFAGHYIPALGAYIHNANRLASVDVKINLVGTLIGNPNTRLECHNYANYLYQLGLVGVEVRDDLDKRHSEFVSKIKKENYLDAFYDWADIWNFILEETMLPSLYNVGPYVDDTSYYLTWLDTPEARCRLHVGNEPFLDFNEAAYNNFLPEIPTSFAHHVATMLDANYSVGFYSGNLDVSCLTTSTDCMLLGLDWWGAEEFRKTNRTPWFHNGVLAGNLKYAGNLYFVVFNNAGHSVPLFKPMEMYDLINSIDFPCKDNPVCLLDTDVPS